MFGMKRSKTVNAVVATFNTAIDDLGDIVDNEEIAQKELNDSIKAIQNKVDFSVIEVERAKKIQDNMKTLIAV